MKSKPLEILEFVLARFIFFLVNILPQKWAYGIGRGIGKLLYKIKSLRNTVLSGLKKAYKTEKTEEEIRDIAKKCCIHWGISLIEYMRLYKINNRGSIDKHAVHKPASDLIKSKLSEGKGCLVISGHFGMWEYMGAGLSHSGIPLNVIMRPLDNRILDKFVSKIRSSFGTVNIPKKQFKPMIKAIKNNEALVFLMDQNSISKSSVFVPFFGEPASTSTGVVWFLKRFKDTPVVMVYPYRDKDNIHRNIAEEVKIIHCDDYDEFAVKNMANMTALIEKYVRMRPEQWMWLHPRWKKEPNEQELKEYNERFSTNKDQS